MDQQQPFPREVEISPMGLPREKLQQCRIDSRPLPRPRSRGGHEHLLVVTLNDVRVAFLQSRDNVVRKLIFVDTVAEAQQFIDIPHCLQGQVQALGIAMKVRNDPNFQWPAPG